MTLLRENCHPTPPKFPVNHYIVVCPVWGVYRPWRCLFEKPWTISWHSYYSLEVRCAGSQDNSQSHFYVICDKCKDFTFPIILSMCLVCRNGKKLYQLRAYLDNKTECSCPCRGKTDLLCLNTERTDCRISYGQVSQDYMYSSARSPVAGIHVLDNIWL